MAEVKSSASNGGSPPNAASVIQILQQDVKPVLHNKFDGLFILLHAIMQAHGFRVVGLGEEGNQIEEKQLPEQWNSSSEVWTFRYRHIQSSLTFILKGLKLGDQLLVHAVALENQKPASMEIKIDDYVNWNESYANNREVKFSDLFKSTDALISKFSKTIIESIFPSAATKQQQEQRPPQQQQQPPDDPLRIGGPRYPPRPIYSEPGYGGQPWPPGDFSVGGGDLYPGGGMFPAPGAPFAGGPGGNLIGPHHPGFGPRVSDPYAPQAGPRPPGRGQGPFPRGPPGARFDPYGPPSNPYGGPDFDDLPPPGAPPGGYDNMFM